MVLYVLNKFALHKHSITQKIRIRLLAYFKTNLLETLIWGETFYKVPRFGSFFQENDFGLVDQILHFEPLTNIHWLRRAELLTDFKPIIQETAICEETFWNVSRLLHQKNGFSIRRPNLAFSNLAPIFHDSKDLIQVFDRL